MTTKRFGDSLPNWKIPARPGPEVMEGVHVRLERMSADHHAADLFRAYSGHDALWDYMFAGPFASASAFHRWVNDDGSRAGQHFYVVRDRASGRCGGMASYLRIAPEAGSIEIGNICLAPEIQHTVAATEMQFLMMDWAFSAGYRRYEWKCDALNLLSRRAAQRFGFSFEGVFRQAVVVKGRNRDTAWFSVNDTEWPALREAFCAWLASANFDTIGRQKERLSDLTRLTRGGSDPTI